MLIAITIILCGCSNNMPQQTIDLPNYKTQTSTPTPSYTATSILTTVPIETHSTEEVSSGAYVPDLNEVTLNGYEIFGSMDINYIKGVQIDNSIKGYQPFYIINRVAREVEIKYITTEIDEVTADIPIYKILTDGDVDYVTITSDLPNETLTAIAYNKLDSCLTVTGFTPNVKRKAVFIYKPNTVFEFSIINDRNPKEGFVCASDSLLKYFSLIKNNAEVKPETSYPIDYTFNIPKNVSVPEKFEVWIKAQPSYSSGSGLSSVYAVAAPIRITMVN
jgi:hypothetical protein